MPNTEAVGTPAIDSSFEDDVYLTVDALPATAGGPVTIGVTVQPLVAWLWGGGVLLVLGALLAAVPGRRRRPTDPVSAPVPGAETGDGSNGSGDAGHPPTVVSVPDRPHGRSGRAWRRARAGAGPGRIPVTPRPRRGLAARAPPPAHRRLGGRGGPGGGGRARGAAGDAPPQTATEVDTPLVGQAAPGIDGSTLGGGSFDLSSLRGRWVVVNFFASWCPPCQQEAARARRLRVRAPVAG